MLSRAKILLNFISPSLFFLGVLFSSQLWSQPVDDVIVRETSRGYDIEVKFLLPLSYQGHSPEKYGNILEVQLRSEGVIDTNLAEVLNDRQNLSWNTNVDLPLREITYDGELEGQPTLVFVFKKSVKFEVKSSSDLRSIFISIITPKPEIKADDSSANLSNVEALIAELKKSDPKQAYLLHRANQAMLDKNYSTAVQLLTKIVETSEGTVHKTAQELLGVAREYNGQLAHAKAEYEKYLEQYPEGVDSERVRQRLLAIITAADQPKEQLRKGKRTQTGKDESSWDTQFYGSFSQTYFRDETSPEDQETQLVRSDISNDLDFVGRARRGEIDLRTQFVGSYQKDLLSDGQGSEFTPNILSFEGRHSGLGIYGRLGRQSRTTGGVLGRFDGVHLAYDASSFVTLNTVYGFPVDTQNKTTINSDQKFYGASVDVAGLFDGWDFNAFYITQENFGVTDREAVGGEVRYFDQQKSLFTLIDYDVFYDDLNIFLLIGNWKVQDNTTLNVVIDYRNSPLLTTTNSIQGQGVNQLDELFSIYTIEELYQLAIDRTAKSQSLTTGVTQQLSDDWQFIGEVTMTEFDDTPASGGVDAIIGTGKEYYYSTQMIGNDQILADDIVILGFRYSDTFSADSYSLSTNWRINMGSDWRFNPRLRVDYRKDKADSDTRWTVRPFVRVDYRFKRWMKFEFDIGYEWLDETFSGVSQTTTGYYLSAGYRAQF